MPTAAAALTTVEASLAATATFTPVAFTSTAALSCDTTSFAATAAFVAPSVPIVLPERVTQIYGTSIPTRMRGIACRAGQRANIKLSILDDMGNPIDLRASPFSGDDSNVLFNFREAVSPVKTAQAVGSVLDAATGVVVATVPESIWRYQGVYIVDVGVMDDDDPNTAVMLAGCSAYLMVEPSTFGAAALTYLFKMPTLQEARLRLRDSGPEENRLLGELEFDGAEMADALVMCVTHWNSSQPPINVFYTTTTYPYFMPEGYMSWLLRCAAIRYMRNHLPYQAGGVSVDDQNKYKEYLAVSKDMWEAYTSFVRQKKAQINMEGAMQSLISPYGRNWG